MPADSDSCSQQTNNTNKKKKNKKTTPKQQQRKQGNKNNGLLCASKKKMKIAWVVVIAAQIKNCIWSAACGFRDPIVALNSALFTTHFFASKLDFFIFFVSFGFTRDCKFLRRNLAVLFKV